MNIENYIKSGAKEIIELINNGPKQVLIKTIYENLTNSKNPMVVTKQLIQKHTELFCTVFNEAEVLRKIKRDPHFAIKIEMRDKWNVKDHTCEQVQLNTFKHEVRSTMLALLGNVIEKTMIERNHKLTKRLVERSYREVITNA